MRYGVISDVHANLPALQRVLEELDLMGVRRIFHAGDVVGYNAFPNEVVAVFKERGIKSITGNHDRAALSRDATGFNPHAAEAVHWTNRALSPGSRDYLLGLRAHFKLAQGNGKVLMAVHHGSPSDPDEYVYEEDICPSYIDEARADLLVLGHTHRPYLATFPGEGTMVNPGSVGQPRDGDWRASFATIEIVGKEMRINVHRVEYDVERTIRANEEAGLPESISERLRKGE